MTERGIEQQPPTPDEQGEGATVEGAREGEQAPETQEGSRKAEIAVLEKEIAAVEEQREILDRQLRRVERDRRLFTTPLDAAEARVQQNLKESLEALDGEWLGVEKKLAELEAELAALMVDTGTAAEKPTDTPTEGPAVETPEAVETIETVTLEQGEITKETEKESRETKISALEQEIVQLDQRHTYLFRQYEDPRSVLTRGDLAAERDPPGDPKFSPKEAEEYRLLTENPEAISKEYWGLPKKIDALKAELAVLKLDTGTAAEKPTDTPTEGLAVETPKTVETVETITPQEALKAVEAMSNQVWETGKSMGYDFALWEFSKEPAGTNLQELFTKNTSDLAKIRDLRGAFDAMVAGQENMKAQIKKIDKYYDVDVGDIQSKLAKLEKGLAQRAKEFADRKVKAEVFLQRMASVREYAGDDVRKVQAAKRELGL